MPAALDWPPVWTLLHVLAAIALGALWSPFDEEAALVGGALVLVSLGLMAWAVWTMKRAGTSVMPGREPEVMVTTGPFAISRNPIYLADLGIVAGAAMIVGQPFGVFLIWPLAKVLERRFIAFEEYRLQNRYGEAFDAYREQTRRWM